MEKSLITKIMVPVATQKFKRDGEKPWLNIYKSPPVLKRFNSNRKIKHTTSKS